MPFYPSLNPNLLAQMPGAVPNMQQILAQQGMQAPAPGAMPPPQPVAAPLPGAPPSVDAMDAQNASAAQMLANMTPAEKQASMQQAAGGFQTAVGGIEAPHKPAPTTQAMVPSTDWTPPGGTAGGAQGGPATYKTTPAHDVSLISPETRGQLEGAEGKQKAAAGEASTAEQGVPNAQAQAAGQTADAASDENLNAQARELDRSKKLAALDADHAKLQSDYANAAPPKDSRGFASRVAGAIAAGLGAYGAAMTHSPNFALEIINKSIDNDIASQREAIDRKGKAADNAGAQLRDLRARFGDDRAAEAALRGLRLEEAKLRGDQIVSSAQSPVIAAKWQGVKADLDKQAAEEKMKTTQYMQSATVQTGGAGMGGGAVSDVKPDEAYQLNDGRWVSISEKDRAKVTGAQNKAQAVEAAGNEIMRLTKMPISERLAHPIDWTHQFDAAKKVMMMSEIEGGGVGQAGKALFEASGKAIGSRTMVWTPGMEKGVTEIVQGAKRSAGNAISNSAQYEISPQLVRNPKTGTVERKYSIVKPFERPKPTPTVRPAGSE